ncbi:cytokinin dehydrogenase 5 [Dorcoceras hygrometricum]|uniref:Cytokinin dehydrogenase 5 n=1 Tax=Dorcoceras hygrometricum TaxID=472368 RepID=A0A2Z7C5K2_9LAMI|nr:cytokinin dehydrogenase 5 [Dorcoceras hygrometricum]
MVKSSRWCQEGLAVYPAEILHSSDLEGHLRLDPSDVASVFCDFSGLSSAEPMAILHSASSRDIPQLEMAPFVPRTRATAAIRMKQIILDNQSRTIRCFRAKLATKRRESAAMKEGLENKLSSLERELQLQRCDNHSLRNMVTMYHKDIDHRISQLVEAKKEHKKIERMKAKKQQAREGHLECHQKLQAHIQQTESTIQEKQLTIETLMEENTSLLQTIHGLQEDNGVPFDDEWKEESKEDLEEEGLEGIPVGEGEIVDE